MLYEIQNPRQHEGEPHRRWFFSHEQDLYVWEAPDHTITAFQLCYGKPANERAVYWRSDSGYAHLRVDEGRRYGTPLLLADGELQVNRVLHDFRRLAVNLPEEIRGFVEDRLVQYKPPKRTALPARSKKKPWWQFW